MFEELGATWEFPDHVEPSNPAFFDPFGRAVERELRYQLALFDGLRGFHRIRRIKAIKAAVSRSPKIKQMNESLIRAKHITIERHVLDCGQYPAGDVPDL